MKPLHVAKEVSRIGVVAGIVYLAAALALLIIGSPHEHAREMTYGALILFPHSVAVAYVASVSTAETGVAIKAMSFASLLLIPAPALALVYGPGPANILFLMVAIPTIAASLLVARARKRTVRTSLAMVASTYAITLIPISYWLLRGPPAKFSEAALPLIIAYPVTLIYAVTVHALPATYGDEPAKPLVPLLPLANAASVTMMLLGHYRYGAWAALLGTLLYIPAARLYKVVSYKKKLAARYRDPSHPAYRGNVYFLEGHIVVMLSIALLAAYTILFQESQCSLLCLIHAYAMGFVTVHVLIHGPMMLPVILRLRHRRRFTLIPLPLALASVLIWPGMGIASLLVYALALTMTVRMVL